MTDIPKNEPAQLRVGDTWHWQRTLSDYPAGAWTLKYRFKNAAGGFEIVCSASGTVHDALVSAANSASYAFGTYDWMAWVEGGSSEKYTVDTGTVELLRDYRAAGATTAIDDRSHARKMLDAIELWLESKSPAVAEYEIAGRRMKYIPIADLIRMRSQYQQEVAGDDAKAKLARGELTGSKIQFRI